MDALSLIFAHRCGQTMYGKTIHCMVYATTVTVQVKTRLSLSFAPLIDLKDFGAKRTYSMRSLHEGFAIQFAISYVLHMAGLE